jgi:hypothetical protein
VHSGSDLKVLFIAGFGPIVRDPGESRELYGNALGIPLKQETDGYLHTETISGAKTFALWPLSRAARSCFGTDCWPKNTISVPQAWIEFDVDNVEDATAILESRGYPVLIKKKRNHGDKSSAVSSRRKECWLASLSLQPCGIRSRDQ